MSFIDDILDTDFEPKDQTITADTFFSNIANMMTTIEDLKFKVSLLEQELAAAQRKLEAKEENLI